VDSMGFLHDSQLAFAAIRNRRSSIVGTGEQTEHGDFLRCSKSVAYVCNKLSYRTVTFFQGLYTG
jgi:hypothetical protein